MKEVSFLNFYKQNPTDFLHYLFLVVAFLQKKNYQNNTVVGVDQIYLGKELIYEEDIYITKNKNIAKESILSKIKKWFHD